MRTIGGLVGVAAILFVGTLILLLQTRREATIAFIQRYGVPMMMGIAYAVFGVLSGIGPSGVAWLSIGFGFVLVVWWTLHYLMTTAALSRALAVGEVDRIMELADKQLRRRRGRARVPYEIARAFALEIGGDFAGALDALAAIAAPSTQAAAVQIAALVELGRAAEARAILDASWATPDAPLPPLAMVERALATGRVRFAEGDHAAATRELERVIAMILATPIQRATAHAYLARIARAAASSAEAAKHEAQVARFAPPASWLQKRPDSANPS